MVIFTYAISVCQTPFYIVPEQGLPSAPPSFRIPSINYECTGTFEPEMLISNIFDTYKWEYSDGRTANGYKPQAITFNKLGNYNGKLTISSNTPFRVIKSIKINKTNNAWYNFLTDLKPDYFFELFSGSKKILKSNQYKDTNTPVDYSMIGGVVLDKTLSLEVYDSDDFDDDFLGSVTIPAGFAGGKLGNGSDFEVEILTELVTTSIFEFNITVKSFSPYISDACLDDVHTLSLGGSYSSYLWSDGTTEKTLVTSVPGMYIVTVTKSNGCIGVGQIDIKNSTEPKPAIDCLSSTLYCNNYNDGQVQWLKEDRTPIIGATKKQYTPNQPGVYFVRSTSLVSCKLTSEGISWPDCKTVANNDISDLRKINVYPNPSDGIYYIDTPVDYQFNIMIINNLNQVISSEQAGNAIDITNQPAGIYYILLTSKLINKRFKIIKY